MLGRFAIPFWLALPLLIPLGAQTPDSVSSGPEPRNPVYIHVESSPTGNVTFDVTSETDDEHLLSLQMDAVPRALDCQWTELNHNEYSRSGICRGWLAPAAGSSIGNLRLAPLVQAMYEQGAPSVSVSLDVRGDKKLSAPKGWIVQGEGRSRADYFTFNSKQAADLPPDFPIPVETPRPVAGLLIPILIVLLAPGLLSYAIRLRTTGASAGQKVNWIVWMNWINLAAWLYWISAINVTELGEALARVGFTSYFAAVGLGVAIYALPPLIAVAACLIAMAPLLSSSPQSFSLLLKRRIVAEASIVIPLGIFLVGSGLIHNRGYYATLSMVGAYLAYRALAWMHWSMSYAEVKLVESGELFERASTLARKAGVTISRLGILETRVREEANAFASSGGAVTLTESLIRGLTPREVDAVIAHELGHHKAGHLRFNLPQLLFWVYIIGVGPLLGWLTSRYNPPAWLMTLPIAPLLFVTLQGFLSQKREFAADARAAELTGDPEGKIAALARLAQLSRIPVEDRGIMGSIMSHPSMEKRVLALARAHNIPDARALAILRNPNEAYGGDVVWLVANEPAPSPTPLHKPAFTLREKMVLVEQLRWWHLLGPLAGACLIAAALGRHAFNPSGATVLGTLGAGPFAILAVTLAVEVLWQVRFERRMRSGVSRQMNLTSSATFAGIHPGRGVRFTEGFAEWDFGFVSLEGDWLCYRGEKVRFAIARQEIAGACIVKGRWTWLREHRVEIVSPGGAFTINTSFTRPTMANARRTEKWIRDWMGGAASAEPAGARPEPPPLLPHLPGIESSRLAAVGYTCKLTLKLWLVGPLLIVAGFNSGMSAVIVAFVAPLAAFLRFLPGMIWPLRRPYPADPQTATLDEASPSQYTTSE